LVIYLSFFCKRSLLRRIDDSRSIDGDIAMNIDKFFIKLSLRRKVIWVGLTAFLPVIIMIGIMIFFIQSIMMRSDKIALAQQVTMVHSFARRVSRTAEKTYEQVRAAIDTAPDSLDKSLHYISSQELLIDDLYVADGTGMVMATSSVTVDKWMTRPEPLFSWIDNSTEWGVAILKENITEQKISVISSHFDDNHNLLFFIVMIFNPSAMVDSFIESNKDLNLGRYRRKITFNYTIDYRDTTHRIKLLEIDQNKNINHTIRTFPHGFSIEHHGHLMQEEPFWQGSDSMLMFSVHKPMVSMADVLHAMGWVLLLGMVACGLIALVLSWITMHHVVFADVEDLVRTMKALESGQLSKRSHVVRDDVMGVIANNINQMAIAIERYTHELEVMSSTDGLTKIYNRVYFMKNLKQLAEDDSETWHQGHILMLDIDHFKQINDTHGHLVGDATLQEIATLCALSLKKIKHIFARFGGEEFIVFIYNETEQTVLQWALEFKQIVAGYPFSGETENNSFSVTISIGITSCQTGSLRECINRADHALYQAKHSGRNCVQFWRERIKTEKK
jgi:diguanylate cyclase (GGDEF)-like protein